MIKNPWFGGGACELTDDATGGVRTTSGGGVYLCLWCCIFEVEVGTSPISYKIHPTPIQQDSLPPQLTNPTPPTPGSKSIFAFWHSGIHSLPPYLLRNVLNWHTRFSPLGWTIYVLDTLPSSPLNISNYINTTSPSVVPAAFTNGTLDGTYAAQHTSDLIRYPFLLKYGGIYLDVGILQFGDLNWLWTQHIANPASPYDFAGFTMGDPPEGISIVNFAFMCAANNPLVRRAHHILLRVWDGQTNTVGTHRHPLVCHVPLLRVPEEVEVDEQGAGEMVINDAVMTDYAIQIQCMGSAQRWADEEGGWDGPAYVREHCWLYSMIDGAFAHEQVTNWSGQRQFELLGQRVPEGSGEESGDQGVAREMVENVVGRSWCLKLGHGFSAKLFGADTLGMLWRKNEGSDCGDQTYAGWLRWAEIYCQQDRPLQPLEIPIYEPTSRGNLLG
ncbi:hypothetical protein GQ44DRAFT_802212 [Phaeosphaeriaceae sp. PMI808]|nr:hypothetical protein GQ44DRAFT_802212 [Phaeosphaeriaceae sp. PMI808]